MNEQLLQFIWQFQYFNKGALNSTNGENIRVYHPGQLNRDQGPDFFNAKIRVGDTTWVGNVELHCHSSDWEKHRHHTDKNYHNVILHVVWVNDKAIENNIPVLELSGRVSILLLQRYAQLMVSSSFIPCEKNIGSVKEIVWRSWKDRLVAERLARKAKHAEGFLQKNNYHWEETFWWLLARNFGMKVNADAFEATAQSLPLSVLAKHKNQIHQLEALLLGQAGLLQNEFEEDYPRMLKKEYLFLKKKYQLPPVQVPVHFLRMRPGNFPTIRLAQLSMVVHESSHLFSKIKETDDLDSIKESFDVTANDYWHYHYRFDELTVFKKKKPGTSMVDNIIINTIVPVLYLYGNYNHEEKYKQKALRWLEQTVAEENAITKGFSQLLIENKNACDSQALIELKNEYCNKKRCLECSVGNAILKG